MIHRAAHLRKVNVEDRTAEFVISTEAVDRHRTVIRSSGWDFENYKRNPIVLYGHRSDDPDYVIGTGEVWMDGTKTMGRATFEEGNEVADKVLRKLENGTLRGASVGFDPDYDHIRWGDEENGEDPDVIYFGRQELLEFSVVPVPSNPEALARSANEIDQIKDKIPKPGSEKTKKGLSKRTEARHLLTINRTQ